jgi:hypothetical protein
MEKSAKARTSLVMDLSMIVIAGGWTIAEVREALSVLEGDLRRMVKATADITVRRKLERALGIKRKPDPPRPA